MSGLSFKDEGGMDARSESVGDVAMKVESYDRRAKSLNGMNVETGEAMSIRLAVREEFARFYVPGDRSLDSKLEIADAKMSNRQSMNDVYRRAGDDGVVLLSQVKQLASGEHIARWPNAMVTQPDNEAFLQGAVRLVQRDKRDADGSASGQKTVSMSAYFPEAARPLYDLKKTDFDSMMSGRAPGMDAPLPRVTVVAVELDGQVKGSALFQPSTKEAGIENGIDAAMSRRVNKYSAMAATVVAAQTGKAFDSLDLSDGGINEVRRQFLGRLYDAVQSKDVNVAVFEGLQSHMMPKIRGNLLNEDHKANAMLDRGFFDAKFVLRLDPSWEDNSSPVVTTVVSDGFLGPKTDQQTNLDDLAARAIDRIAGAPRIDPQADKVSQAAPVAGKPSGEKAAEGPGSQSSPSQQKEREPELTGVDASPSFSPG